MYTYIYMYNHRFKVLSMWGVGGLQVYGICSRRLVYSKVV